MIRIMQKQATGSGIDLAILENGQYNEEWSLIHLMPQYMAQTARDLKAKRVLTVHHSKYALAKHRWDEPLKNAEEMKNKDSLNVLIPEIGEVVALEKQCFTQSAKGFPVCYQ